MNWYLMRASDFYALFKKILSIFVTTDKKISLWGDFWFEKSHLIAAFLFGLFFVFYALLAILCFFTKGTITNFTNMAIEPITGNKGTIASMAILF